MTKKVGSAASLHNNIPPDWYYSSIRENIFQRYWHNRRFEEASKLMEPVEGKVLDIGCADGVFTKVILDGTRAKEVIGIDVLKPSLDWADKHWKKNKKMKFKVGDAHNLDFGAGTFDAVFVIEVLEHVFDPLKVLKEIKRVLKKEGYAVFLVPTESLLFRIVWFFWSFYRGKIWKETHIHAYRHDYLVKLCEQVGFSVERNKKFILGMLQAVRARKV